MSGVVAQSSRTHRVSAEGRFPLQTQTFLERCYTPVAIYPACHRSYPAAEDAIREEPHRLQVRVKVNALGEHYVWRRTDSRFWRLWDIKSCHCTAEVWNAFTVVSSCTWPSFRAFCLNCVVGNRSSCSRAGKAQRRRSDCCASESDSRLLSRRN